MIQEFNATIAFVDYNTTNGQIEVNSSSLPDIFDITFTTIEDGGYYTRTYEDVNKSLGELEGSLFPLAYSFGGSISNFTSYEGSDYAIRIVTTASYECETGMSAQLILENNTGTVQSANATCDGTNNTIGFSYQHTNEEAQTLTLRFEADNGYERELDTETITFDLNAPTVKTASISLTNGFSTGFAASSTAVCTDTINHDIHYEVIVNGAVLDNASYANDTTRTNGFVADDGVNTLTVRCSDAFYTTSTTINRTWYVKTLQLIDERTKANFDVSNLTSAVVYFDDNSTFFDFKNASTYQVNFSSNSSVSLRFELGYPDNELVTRLIRTDLVPQDPVLVCANKDDVTHYSQLAFSTSERTLSVKSQYAQCYVVADSTRFAYQDALMLQFYTITSLYSIYTYDDGQQVILASLDGSISSSINIDTLEFARQDYNLGVLSETVNFENINTNTTVLIYYRNLKLDSESIDATITRDGDTLFTDTITNTPNEWTLYFDYSTLNLSGDDPFKLTLEITRTDGSVDTKTYYFDTRGRRGIIPAPVGVTVSVLLMLFGLTFAAARVSIGWFGVVSTLAAIIMLTIITPSPITNVILAAELIVLVFLILITARSGYGEVVG